MCKCGKFTKQDLKYESRKLWRGVAIGYSADGHHKEKMSEWANSAVSQYTNRFITDIEECTCNKDNTNETN